MCKQMSIYDNYIVNMLRKVICGIRKSKKNHTCEVQAFI